MFEEFFSKTFYGNTLFTWLVAGGIIVTSLLFGRAMYWFCSKVVKQITRRTKSKLDDILIDILEEPIVLAIVLAGIWYALGILHISPQLDHWIRRAYHMLIVFNATWLISRLIDTLIREYAMPWTTKTRSDLDDHILPLFRKSIRITLWIVAIIIAADNAGYNLSTLIAGLGIGGLAFALAAKETLANFIAGVTIVADRPFSANQWILVKGYRAKVEEVGIRSTRFRTDKGTLVTIPNSDLVNTTIENYSEGPGITEETVIPISYEVDEVQLAFAFNILREVVKANPNVANLCIISFDTMTEHALLVKLRYYINPQLELHAAVRTEIFLEIYKQFRKHNIKIAKPIHQVELNGYTKDESAANLYQNVR